MTDGKLTINAVLTTFGDITMTAGLLTLNDDITVTGN